MYDHLLEQVIIPERWGVCASLWPVAAPTGLVRHRQLSWMPEVPPWLGKSILSLSSCGVSLLVTGLSPDGEHKVGVLLFTWVLCPSCLFPGSGASSGGARAQPWWYFPTYTMTSSHDVIGEQTLQTKGRARAECWLEWVTSIHRHMWVSPFPHLFILIFVECLLQWQAPC